MKTEATAERKDHIIMAAPAIHVPIDDTDDEPTPNPGNATPAMPTHPEVTRVARRLVAQARDRLNVPRADAIPDTQVARAAGCSRNFVKTFRTEERDDATLTLWLAAMLESGGDPTQALADALAKEAK